MKDFTAVIFPSCLNCGTRVSCAWPIVCQCIASYMDRNLVQNKSKSTSKWMHVIASYYLLYFQDGSLPNPVGPWLYLLLNTCRELNIHRDPTFWKFNNSTQYKHIVPSDIVRYKTMHVYTLITKRCGALTINSFFEL